MSVDKKIEELEVNRAPMNISRETIEFIVNSVLFEDVKVLEIGTFNGYSALWFSTIASRVLGIDISGTNVEEARKNLEGTDVEIVLGNALDIVPKLEEKTGRLPQIEGQPPLLYNLPPGDSFAPRSTLTFTAEDAERRPPLIEGKPDHWVQLSKSSVADYDKYAHMMPAEDAD